MGSRNEEHYTVSATIKPNHPWAARPTLSLRSLAGELAETAARATCPGTRSALERLIPKVRRMEATLDEMVAEAMEEAMLPGTVVQ